MANLAEYQKLTRVLPGQPSGNGADGVYSSATIPTLTKDSCSGTATSTTLTTTGSTFANGDVLLIHQVRGTGVGQWEINKVVSGGGTTTLTLQQANHYTFTDSGSSQAQAIKILQYTNTTVQTGTWTVPTWDGNVGGIFPLAIKGTLTITGTISANSKGFGGGSGGNNSGNIEDSGEGTVGASVNNSSSANGNGGGGGKDGSPFPGGGSNGTAGGGTNPGATSGSADLTTMVFGGGGGGQGLDAPRGSASSARGAGIVLLFAKQITITGGISATGENASVTGSGVAGSGAGGSILIVCQTATLGTTLVTSPGGTTSSTGGDGRIAVHHSGTVTGTTNPTFTDVTDTSLVEKTFLGGMI